jgi:hypothetical protein
MKDLIFETMLAEASFRLAEKTITGIDLEEAIHEVSSELHLDRNEVKELTERSKKAPTPAPTYPVAEEDNALDMDSLVGDMGDDEEAELESSEANQISFDSEDELETAMGVLMYKGIAWTNRSGKTITFGNADDVSSAHDALKRRWDFVNLQQRTVAVLEFDNLEDYAKVLDFLATKNMTVLQGDLKELDNDVELEIAEAEETHKRDRKAAKDAGLPAPEEVSQDMSYKALHKDKLIDPKSLDVMYDAGHRALRVVKRWK